MEIAEDSLSLFAESMQERDCHKAAIELREASVTLYRGYMDIVDAGKPATSLMGKKYKPLVRQFNAANETFRDRCVLKRARAR